jgi:hypothetical protein
MKRAQRAAVVMNSVLLALELSRSENLVVLASRLADSPLCWKIPLKRQQAAGQLCSIGDTNLTAGKLGKHHCLKSELLRYSLNKPIGVHNVVRRSFA